MKSNPSNVVITYFSFFTPPPRKLLNVDGKIDPFVAYALSFLELWLKFEQFSKKLNK